MGIFLALIAIPAQAYPEAEAASLHADVVRAWHEPAVVEPGTQWQGFLQLREDVAPSSVSYQVCNVADGYCFAPPHPANKTGNGTYSFHTVDYLANGKPVEWGSGWEVGVRWFLADGSGNGTWVPPQGGPTIASHYLTFPIATERERQSPAAGMAIAACLLALLAWRRR